MYKHKQTRRMNCSLDILPESSEEPIRVKIVDQADSLDDCFKLTPQKLSGHHQQSEAKSKRHSHEPLNLSEEQYLRRRKSNFTKQVAQKSDQ